MKTSDLRSKFSTRIVNERPEISTVYTEMSAYLCTYICKPGNARFGDLNGIWYLITVKFFIFVSLSYPILLLRGNCGIKFIFLKTDNV